MKTDLIQDISLYNKISSLPKELKEEVLHFTEFLKQKVQSKKAIKERKFGSAKGAFVLAEDFDTPLEDFNEYM